MLTPQEVADDMQVSLDTVKRRIRDGSLPAINIAGAGGKNDIFRIDEKVYANWKKSKDLTVEQSPRPKNPTKPEGWNDYF